MIPAESAIGLVEPLETTASQTKTAAWMMNSTAKTAAAGLMLRKKNQWYAMPDHAQ